MQLSSRIRGASCIASAFEVNFSTVCTTFQQAGLYIGPRYHRTASRTHLKVHDTRVIIIYTSAVLSPSAPENAILFAKGATHPDQGTSSCRTLSDEHQQEDDPSCPNDHNTRPIHPSPLLCYRPHRAFRGVRSNRRARFLSDRGDALLQYSRAGLRGRAVESVRLARRDTNTMNQWHDLTLV